MVIIIFLVTISAAVLKGDKIRLESVEELRTLHEMLASRALRDFVKDHTHIVEDLENMMELGRDVDLTGKEMTFYYHRMHDFDDNGVLDGIELRAAIFHKAPTHREEGGKKPVTWDDDVIEKAVDKFMKFDKNNDGFLSYPEFVRTDEEE